MQLSYLSLQPERHSLCQACVSSVYFGVSFTPLRSSILLSSYSGAWRNFCTIPTGGTCHSA